MPFTQAAYCSVTDLQNYIGRVNDTLATAEITWFTSLVQAASTMIDQLTSTWWDVRSVSLSYTPLNGRTQKLFMPAPIQSLTSVVEGTTTLVSGTDYAITDNGCSLTRLPGNNLSRNLTFNPRIVAWGQNATNGLLEGSVTVAGSLGPQLAVATTPTVDVKMMAVAIAAVLGGLARKTYQGMDGQIVDAPVSNLPYWTNRLMTTHRYMFVPMPYPTVTYT